MQHQRLWRPENFFLTVCWRRGSALRVLFGCVSGSEACPSSLLQGHNPALIVEQASTAQIQEAGGNCTVRLYSGTAWDSCYCLVTLQQTKSSLCFSRDVTNTFLGVTSISPLLVFSTNLIVPWILDPFLVYNAMWECWHCSNKMLTQSSEAA